jgi:hypothetical protein
MYVAVQVPEDRLAAVYELLLDRPSRRLVAPPAIDDDTAHASAPASDVASADASQLWDRVMPETREVLKVLTRRPNEELTLDQLSAQSKVDNVGAALQSLRIQRRKLGIASPVVKRRTRDGNRYSMSAETAARFARLAS